MSGRIYAALYFFLFVHFSTNHIIVSGAPSRCSVERFLMCQDEFIPSSVKHFTVSSASLKSDSSYGTNFDCYLLINHQLDRYVLVLQFDRFDVEFQENCDYDSLMIAGQTFCGNWLEGKTLKLLISAFKLVEFHFTSDSSISGAGFSVRVDLIPYLEGETIFEYDGPGSSYRPAYVLSSSRIADSSGHESNFLDFLTHFPSSQNRSQTAQDSSGSSHVVSSGQPMRSHKEYDAKWFDLKYVDKNASIN